MPTPPNTPVQSKYASPGVGARWPAPEGAVVFPRPVAEEAHAQGTQTHEKNNREQTHCVTPILPRHLEDVVHLTAASGAVSGGRGTPVAGDARPFAAVQRRRRIQDRGISSGEQTVLPVLPKECQAAPRRRSSRIPNGSISRGGPNPPASAPPLPRLVGRLPFRHRSNRWPGGGVALAIGRLRSYQSLGLTRS